MDNFSKEEICNALVVIRTICRQIEHCPECPFFNEDQEHCVIMNKAPSEWLFADEYTTWRAVR